MHQILRRAMHQPERWVIAFEYLDAKGAHTQRVVSPIRFLASDRFLALCLCREEPRQFQLDRCRNLQLRQAAEYMMPVPMGC